MVDWFLLPQRLPRMPSNTDISAALDALLVVSTPDELSDVLETWQQILFTDITRVVLCLTAARERVRGDSEFGDHLQDMLSLLEYMRVTSITDIAQVLQAEDEQQGAAFEEAPEIALPRRIKLLTEAMSYVPRSSDPVLWAELHRERANTHMLLAPLNERDEHTEQAILDYDITLEVFTCQQVPFLWAGAHLGRGLAYKERVHGEEIENWEQARTDFSEALAGLAIAGASLEQAATFVERGLIYLYRKRGDREDNLELALADFDAGLQLLSQQDTPVEWATTVLYRVETYMQRNRGAALTEKCEWAIADCTAVLDLITYEQAPDKWMQASIKRGVAYMQRPQGERSENITRAITDFGAALSATTHEERPEEWADAHLYRGIAHASYILDDRASHVEQGITDFDAALTVFTCEQHPYKWAVAHSGRGTLYREYTFKEQARYLELAIDDLNMALDVLRFDETPEEWASTHMHRGIVYTERMYGDHARNVEQAIADFNDAFKVFTQQTAPYEWAVTCLNQGLAYADRIPDRWAENNARAIVLYEHALEVLTQEKWPNEWALTHMNLSHAYAHSPSGERKENLEQAMREANAALTVFTRETAPIDWARTSVNRTFAYAQLMREYHHKENLDHAITDYNAVLEVFTPETTPRYWAITIMNRGGAYLDRSLGMEADNVEAAIADFNAALTVITPETMLSDWVLLHHNRGLAYAKRVVGEKAENLEQAIADFNAIIAVLAQDQWPYMWASTYRNRAGAYAERISGDPLENLQQAIADAHIALQVFTREATPREYRDIRIVLGRVYELLGRWREVADVLKQAREVMHMLMETASTEEGRADVISEQDTASLHLREALALLRCNPPDPITAVCVLEEGRAQNLRTALDLDAVNPEHYTDEARRTRAEVFVHTRDEWRKAQLLLTDTVFVSLSPKERYAENAQRRPRVNAAHAAFIRARDAIRLHDDPNFLAPRVTLEDIGRAVVSPTAALVYLAAAEESGLALLVMKTPDDRPSVEYIPLPQLNRKAVLRLLLATDELPPLKLMEILGGHAEVPFLSGGLWMAQLHMALEFLTMWGETIEQAMQALPNDATYLEAAQDLIRHNTDNPDLTELLKQPFDAMSIQQRLHLGTVFSTLVINAELKRSLPKLGELGLNKVVSVLTARGINDVTLIPYGQLGLFPLPAVLIRLSDGKEQRFSDLFTTTVAPGARAKEMAFRQAVQFDRTERPLILAVGNPQPVPEDVSSLVFAEAEADTLRHIAKMYQYPTDAIRCLRLRHATRASIIEALEQAWYAHLAVHGQYDFSFPRRSRLVVAGNSAVPEPRRSIYLSEALDGTVNLKGLRLLVLSGCETALIEAGNMPDEMLGLAAGFLQAGAAGVIASLWAVNDHATYLLMSRFAQLYLDPQRNWSPAHALAEAQRWLREEATNSMLQSYNPAKSPLPVKLDPALSTLRSLRCRHSEALSRIRLQASYRAEREPDALPYADPIYWAGFFVTGC